MANSIFITRNNPLSSDHTLESELNLVVKPQQMAGIKKANYVASKNRIIVEYDLLKVSYRQLLSVLVEKGVGIKKFYFLFIVEQV